MGNVFIFCVIEDPNYGFMSMITPKHFEELTEATFASEKSDVECIH